MRKVYKNNVKSIQEAFDILNDFVDTLESVNDTDIGYRFRIDKKNEGWVVKMFVNEKETMDKIFGRIAESSTIL